jgi:hypothetical protein
MILLQELLPTYSESIVEASKRSGRSVRNEDLRLAIAHIVRLSALSLPPGHLIGRPGLCQHYSTFLDTTLRHVSRTPPGMFWEAQELQYCAASTAASVCGQVRLAHPHPFAPAIRERLWDACKAWLCLTEGFREAPDAAAAVARERARTLDRVRDLEQRSVMDREMQNCVDALRLCSIRVCVPLCRLSCQQPESNLFDNREVVRLSSKFHSFDKFINLNLVRDTDPEWLP